MRAEMGRESSAIASASRTRLGRRKRCLGVLAALPLVLAVFTTVGHAATLEEIRKRGYIVVVTQGDFPPFEYRTSRGVIGFDNELLLGLRKASGLKIRQETAPLCEILSGVASGKYDVAATVVAITPDTLKHVGFTQPVAESSMAYVKRKDDRSIFDVNDATTKSVGVQKCSAVTMALAQLRTTIAKSGGRLGEVIEYGDFAEAYQDLVSGHVRAVINNRASLSEIVRATSGLLELSDALGPKIRMAWAVQKNNDGVLAFLNTYLDQQRASGALTRLRLKYGLLDDSL